MTNILVVNQHGSNRGDEAACRGMIYGIRRFIPDATFNILTVYPLNLEGLNGVSLLDNLPLRGLEGTQFLRRMLRYLVSFYTNIRATTYMRQVFEWYRKADLIISAPGGPYIGDLYPWTQKEMAFHILLGTLMPAFVMLYAPSVGPFQSKFDNYWRRALLKHIDLITVRESFSAAHLTDLGIQISGEYITADSALQCPVNSFLGQSVFVREGLDPNNKYIGFIPLELARFHSESERLQYITLLVELLRWVESQYHIQYVFFPQGYGAWHDKPFLEFIRTVSGLGSKITILPETCNSDEQQALMGKMDLVISFRYHPTIFALRQFVPCVAVAYEHKVKGFMQAIGMQDYCLDLKEMTLQDMTAKVTLAWQSRGNLKYRMQMPIEKLELASLKNSFLASLLIQYYRTKSKTNLEVFIKDALDSEWYNV